MSGPESLKPKRYFHLIMLLFLLAAMAYVGVSHVQDHIILIWIFNIAGIIAFCGIVGHALHGYWRSLLIDSRYKISLSRLQMISWTAVVLGSIFTAGVFNIVAMDLWSSPLNIDIPTELYLLMGISASSMVASPALLTSRPESPRTDELTALNEHREKEGLPKLNANELGDGVVRNRSAGDARWLDLFKGEKVGDGVTTDLARIQMFLFTAIILFSYASAFSLMIGKAAEEGTAITGFPEIDGGLIVLVGISHSAYLANKAIPKK